MSASASYFDCSYAFTQPATEPLSPSIIVPVFRPATKAVLT